MPIPDYQTLMLPVLRFISDGQDHAVTEVRDQIAVTFHLNEEELSQKLKSGSTLFANRVAWALSYLNKAELLTLVARGIYRITERGTGLLSTDPAGLTAKDLKQFPGFQSANGSPEDGEPSLKASANIDPETPEERLESSFQVIRDALARDLIQLLLTVPPAAFEKLVVNLLVAMGYGGSMEDAGSVVGKSGDGGIDGIIKQDKLGLDAVYVQAKRWQNSVGSPDVMKFSGSLTKRHASKGVFITTSYFSKDALEYVQGIPQKIILIDGTKLASLMIDHNVGITQTKAYVLKRLDPEYFDSLTPHHGYAAT